MTTLLLLSFVKGLTWTYLVNMKSDPWIMFIHFLPLISVPHPCSNSYNIWTPVLFFLLKHGWTFDITFDLLPCTVFCCFDTLEFCYHCFSFVCLRMSKLPISLIFALRLSCEKYVFPGFKKSRQLFCRSAATFCLLNQDRSQNKSSTSLLLIPGLIRSTCGWVSLSLSFTVVLASTMSHCCCLCPGLRHHSIHSTYLSF